MLDITRLRRQYLDYLDSKQAEIDEARTARHYYHGNQWTREELRVLKQRGQPPVTSNMVARKCNAIVGLMERLRQDPKAQPRTPNHEQGAELVTAAVRYVLDNNDWGSIRAECELNASIDGIAGLELSLEDDENGEPEVVMNAVEPETFFYDPRSFRPDFSDARYMGVAKWVSDDLAMEMFPEHAETLEGYMSGQDYGMAAGDQDRERKWIDTNQKRLRLVEHWYKHQGKWHYCYHVGTMKLTEGESPFLDEKGKSDCRYIMFSAHVDHDGDRYGHVRNMKSPQDEVNHHKSKAIYTLSQRKIIAEEGAVDDVDKAKREYAKSDAWITYNKGFELREADRSLDLQGEMLFLEKAENEISTFAPDPAALTGSGERAIQSGRAIALLQQAGMAELGPFILAHRGWKFRVYRAVWSLIKRFWKAERWIRVTDDEDVAEFIQINGFEIDPERGPVMVNALGQMDVDMILDEGPDTVNMMQDAFDAIVNSGIQVPDRVMLELAPIQASVKKKIREQMEQAQQSNPMQQQALMLEMQKLQAEVAKLTSETAENESQILLNRAKAMEELSRTDREEFKVETQPIMAA